EAPCLSDNRPCLLNRIESLAGKITEDRWRDATYRELAKTLAFDGLTDRAVGIVGKIKAPDTRAMAIRGIGMTVAERKTLPLPARKIFYDQLEAAAKAIDHAPSRAIALTYISMAQAFAGDDDLALATARSMDNDSLRNKAFGETAEIQAERGAAAAALSTLQQIASVPYRDKQHLIVLKILANAGQYDEALKAVWAIENPVLQSEGIQYLLDARTPREPEKDTKRGLNTRQADRARTDP
ncbi:MAG TPA: hypothetical protein PKX87_01470, partial [Alphaproteobacteria bacterium]|nr:hypothetical protein [Alphaproteobacteria bacterium]